MLLLSSPNGYAAQEFISADAESGNPGPAALKFAMTVPVQKAGLAKGPPFC
jgi:hypothetical protein